MEKLTTNALLEHTKNNEIEILTSKECYCLFCGMKFPAKEMRDWAGERDGMRAICPSCGAHYVVGDAVLKKGFTKKQIHEACELLAKEILDEDCWSMAERYCEAYQSNDIEPTGEATETYVKFLRILTEAGDPRSAEKLAEFYLTENPHTGFDPKKAFELLSEEPFRADPFCAYLAGCACEMAREEIEGAHELAFECYSRAYVLGNKKALSSLAFQYLDNDPMVAFTMLANKWAEYYCDFFHSSKDDEFEDYHLCALLNLAVGLGKFYEKGIGVRHDPYLALYFMLIARFLLREKEEVDSLKYLQNAIEEQIEGVRKSIGYDVSEQPKFDDYSFLDSFETLSATTDLPFECEVQDADEMNSDLRVHTRLSFIPIIIDTNSVYASYGPNDIEWTFHAELVKGPKNKELHIDYVRANQNVIQFCTKENPDWADDVVYEFKLLREEVEG